MNHELKFVILAIIGFITGYIARCLHDYWFWRD